MTVYLFWYEFQLQHPICDGSNKPLRGRSEMQMQMQCNQYGSYHCQMAKKGQGNGMEVYADGQTEVLEGKAQQVGIERAWCVRGKESRRQ